MTPFNIKNDESQPSPSGDLIEVIFRLFGQRGPSRVLKGQRWWLSQDPHQGYLPTFWTERVPKRALKGLERT
jgi:hypothetical protein